MGGRVTQSMLSSQLIRNLNRNMTKMDKQQNELSTGMRINRPSDDPVGIAFSMRYRSELAANDQYSSNADAAASWLDYSDTMMGQAGDVLQRTRELLVQAANGSNSQDALNSIKSEIQQLGQQITNIGNSQFNGRYMFNGQMTETQPYDPTTATDPVTGDLIVNAAGNDTDNGAIQLEIGTGVYLPVNVTGQQVFGSSADPDNMFKIFENIQNALNKQDTSALSNLVGTLDSRMSKVLAVRSDIGAKSNRLTLAQGRLTDISTNLSNLQAKTEDVDMAALITNLKVSENVYQASLSAGSHLIQPSLLDFLK
jgi:flagellar hook-associated protein 3 FlgL